MEKFIKTIRQMYGAMIYMKGKERIIKLGTEDIII